MNATGTNTAASTSVIVTIGAVISAMAARTAWSGRSPRSRNFSTFSTTMIASSTTRPIARIKPAERQRVDREAEGGHHREGRHQRDRDRQHRDDRRPHALQEHEDDDQHQQERLEQRVLDLLDVLADVLGRVVIDPVLEARAGSSWPGGPCSRVTWRTMSRALASAVLVDRQRAGRLAVQPAGGIVVLRVELDPGDVARAGRSSRRRGGGR